MKMRSNRCYMYVFSLFDMYPKYAEDVILSLRILMSDGTHPGRTQSEDNLKLHIRPYYLPISSYRNTQPLHLWVQQNRKNAWASFHWFCCYMISVCYTYVRYSTQSIFDVHCLQAFTLWLHIPSDWFRVGRAILGFYWPSMWDRESVVGDAIGHDCSGYLVQITNGIHTVIWGSSTLIQWC